MGVTRLRLARFGNKNRPYYRVVAVDSRVKRDGKPLEFVRATPCAVLAHSRLLQLLHGARAARYAQQRLQRPPHAALARARPMAAALAPQLGTYDPIPMKKDGMKEVRLKVDRVKYWLGVGAQPSDSVAHLLWKAGLVPAPPIRFQPIKSVPKAERE